MCWLVVNNIYLHHCNVEIAKLESKNNTVENGKEKSLHVW